MIPRIKTESVALTDVGLVRRHNEDNFLDHAAIGLWAVADGMGGHMAGEVASGLIVETLAEMESVSSGYAFLDDVRDRLDRVNRALIARAAALEPGAVIGSTVVALIVYEGHYACLWAGDSRLYLLRNQRLEQVTRDHSMLQEMLDSGSLQQSDVKNFKRSNVITRAVGVSDKLVLDMCQGPMQAGDIFLLCSDGLHGMLQEWEISDAIMSVSSLESAAQLLIDKTIERGARDNVTLVLVRVNLDPDDTLRQAVIPAW